MIYLTPEKEKKIILERQRSWAKFLYEQGKPVRRFLKIEKRGKFEKIEITEEVREKGLITVLHEQLKEERK